MNASETAEMLFRHLGVDLEEVHFNLTDYVKLLIYYTIPLPLIHETNSGQCAIAYDKSLFKISCVPHVLSS